MSFFSSVIVSMIIWEKVSVTITTIITLLRAAIIYAGLQHTLPIPQISFVSPLQIGPSPPTQAPTNDNITDVATGDLVAIILLSATAFAIVFFAGVLYGQDQQLRKQIRTAAYQLTALFGPPVTVTSPTTNLYTSASLVPSHTTVSAVKSVDPLIGCANTDYVPTLTSEVLATIDNSKEDSMAVPDLPRLQTHDLQQDLERNPLTNDDLKVSPTTSTTWNRDEDALSILEDDGIVMSDSFLEQLYAIRTAHGDVARDVEDPGPVLKSTATTVEPVEDSRPGEQGEKKGKLDRKVGVALAARIAVFEP